MLVTSMIDARRSLGMSQRALAARVGVPTLRIKRLERGVGSATTLTAAMAALDF